MKNKILLFLFFLFFFNSCVGTSSQGLFGTGVSVAIDPRSLGTQIDDNIMQKNLTARLVIQDKKYLRPEELDYLKGDPTRAKKILGWEPEYTFETMIDEMIEHWEEVL